MKKLFLLLAATLTLSALTNAQSTDVKKEVKSEKQDQKAARQDIKKDRKALRKLEGSEVSYQAQQSFAADYPKAAGATWKRDGAYDRVAFTQDGNTMAAYYDINAKLVGTVTDKKYEDLPATAREYIAKKYGDYTRGPVIHYDDNESNDTDMILYGTQFEDQDNYFIELTKNGKTDVLQVNPEGEVFFFATVK